MATYNYKGQDYELSDSISPDKALEMLAGQSGSSSSFNAKQKSPSHSFFGDIDPDSLKHDQDWVDASKIIFKKNTGVNFRGTDDQAAQYGLSQMGWFNYNLPAMVIDAAQIQAASPTEKQAFLYLMDTYDDLKMSWAGVGRFVKGAATDPTNYMGLATFGIGTAASTAEKIATKAGVKSMLRAGIDAGIMGGVQSAVSDSSRQSVEMSNNPNQEFSYSRLAGSTAFGAAAGGVLGAGVDAVATGLRKVTPKDVPHVPEPPVTPEARPPEAPVIEPKQLDLGLEQQPYTQQPSLPGVLDVPQPAPNNEINSILEWQKRFTPKEEPVAPVTKDPNQGDLNLVQPKDKPFAYDGQGNLFEGLPLDKIGPERPKDTPKLTEKPVEGPSASKGTPTPREPTPAVPDAPLLSERLNEAIAHVQGIMKATDGDGANAIIEAIKKAVSPEGWKFGLNQTVDASTREAIALLNKLDIRSLAEADRVFEAAGLSSLQSNALKVTINESGAQAKNVLAQLMTSMEAATNPREKAYLKKLIEEYRPVQDMLAQLYLESSSGTGQLFGASVGNPLAGKNRAYASPDEILRRSGIEPSTATPKQRAAADAEFLKQHLDLRNQFLDHEQVKALDVQIERAKDSMDMKTADRLIQERKALIDSLSSDAMEEAGIGRATAIKINRMVNEYVISTVFTPSTAVINTLPSLMKTLYKPLLNYLADPNASIRGMTTQYAMMWNHISMASRLAQASFAYEHAMLTGDVGRFLEQSPEFKGTFGRVLRTFPRILQATDEFFFALNYHGFVAGEAMNRAIGEAERIGLKRGSTEYEAHLKDALDRAVKDAYTPNADATELLSFLRQNGIDQGHSGEALHMYMKTELQKNGDLFKEAANLEGKNYADDLLFRRKFSGEGASSNAAQKYEAFMNNNALMRIGFQLFIRTPIRVFEEGIRLTPGINLIAPKFLDDLKGLNGTVRQVRAKGEAMLSMAFAGAVLSMYANGAITGSGAGDYKQQRDKANGGTWQPYTIYFPNGGTLSFRNLDPFSTPLKIMANALEKMQMHEYRKAQGEYLLDNHNETIALLGIGAMSLMEAVKDSGLTDGIQQLSTLITDLSDMEHKQDAITKFFGQKLQLAVPNVIGKTQTLFGGPVPMNDPHTIDQMIEVRFSPYSGSIPRQRDALGNVREISNPVASYFGIGVDNLMDRPLSTKAKEVLKALANIDYASNTNFALPTTAPNYFAGVDLRDRYTREGQTWNDRINDLYKDSGVVDALHSALVKNDSRTSYGTATFKGTKVELAKSIISDFRNVAILKFIKENPEAQALYKFTVQNQANGMAGKLDVKPTFR